MFFAPPPHTDRQTGGIVSKPKFSDFSSQNYYWGLFLSRLEHFKIFSPPPPRKMAKSEIFLVGNICFIAFLDVSYKNKIFENFDLWTLGVKNHPSPSPTPKLFILCSSVTWVAAMSIWPYKELQCPYKELRCPYFSVPPYNEQSPSTTPRNLSFLGDATCIAA